MSFGGVVRQWLPSDRDACLLLLDEAISKIKASGHTHLHHVNVAALTTLRLFYRPSSQMAEMPLTSLLLCHGPPLWHQHPPPQLLLCRVHLHSSLIHPSCPSSPQPNHTLKRNILTSRRCVNLRAKLHPR